MKTSTHFVRLSETPFSRRGSYFAFFLDVEGGELFAGTTLYIGSTRGGGATMNTATYRQIKAEIVKDGRPVPTAVSTTNSEVIMQSDYGEFRFCIGERRFVRIKGTDGLSLRLTPKSSPFGSTVTDLMDGAWQFDFNESIALLIPFKGTVKANRAFGGNFFGVVGMNFEITPDENGVVDIGIEEFTIDPIHRPFDRYPSYEKCVKDYQDEFDAFAKAVCPSLPAKYESMRLKALWNTWCLMVEPDGEAMFKHTMIKMMRGIFEHVSGWQQAHHIICLSRDVKLAWNILCGLFDYQDANGRIADILDNNSHNKIAMKPPFQGVSLMWLLDNCDNSEIPFEDKKHVYQGMVRWTEFFFKCRDIDKDGIWENRSAVETGWEDAAYFEVGFPLASPDLNAYLAIQMEAQAKLGRMIGIDEKTCAGFEAGAKALVQKIIEKFWDGERWIAFNCETLKKSDTKSLPLFATLILGKRLPQDIIDKSIKYIFEDNAFLTPYGLASEALDSDYFAHGWSRGCVNTPVQLILCMALEACGRPELAKKVALRYLDMLNRTGMYHMSNALTGLADKTMVGTVTNGEKYLFWSGWTSSCYLFLAERYGKEQIGPVRA